MIAPLAAGTVRHMQAPIRMLAVQLAVRRNHLRFEPQTELHPLFPNPLYQILQTVREFFPVHYPIAQ
ncbi:hypothetical protein D3C73_1588140 [compost metagenome]